MGHITARNLPCPDSACGSSDAYQVYDDGSGYCFSCAKYFSNGKHKKEKMIDTPTEKENTNKENALVEEIKTYQVRGFQERKIKKAVCEFFGVRVGYNSSGEISEHYYPYPHGFKQRVLPKTFFFIGSAGGLFGKDNFPGGGKRLIITEGEIDALSVAQASLDRYDKIYPVVSLRSASTTKDLLTERAWIRSFQEVVLWFDDDDPGREATQKALKIIGYDKCKVVKPVKDCKDANDVLRSLSYEKVNQCIWDAEAYTPSGIIGKEDLWNALVEYNSVQSVPYPPCIDGLNTKIKGMRKSEIVLFISGCFSKGTDVLMFDGSIKKVEDVRVEDYVMGATGEPRKVLKLCQGREKMVDVVLRDGTGFRCNISHILTLVNTNESGRYGLAQNDVIDVSVSEFSMFSERRKQYTKAIKSKRLDFQKNFDLLPIDPYILGVWLGDGSSANAIIYSHADNIAVIDKLRKHGLNIYKGGPEFNYNSPGGLRNSLRGLSVFGNKHIPEVYLKASIADRLELLAGLLDTDGCYDRAKNTYEFSQKSEVMIRQVERLAMSLGFTTSVGKQKNNKFGNCYRLWISGSGLEDIPVALNYKKARPRLQIKNSNRYAFTIQAADEEDYYGFTLDGDGRFVLGNFIITHNSGAGKSSMFREIMLHVLETTDEKIGVISLEESPQETARKLSAMPLHKNPAEEEIPLDELKVGFDKVFGSDRVILLDHNGETEDTSIMEYIEFMALSGATYIFLDHITLATAEDGDSDNANSATDKLMSNCLKIVKKYPVFLGLISHLRKSPNGKKSYEEGLMPNVDAIKGSGSIKQISFDIVAFARNLTAPDESVRNTIEICVLKSRYSGLTGPVQGSFYNRKTGRLSLAPREKEFEPIVTTTVNSNDIENTSY